MRSARFEPGPRAIVWLVRAARVAAGLVVLSIVVALATLSVSTLKAADADASATASAPTSATHLPAFSAGDIISDDTFYDSGSMTQAGIQSWLLAMPCVAQDGVPCLAFYHQDTSSRPANGNCLAYRGGASQTASEIVYGVARACGISPRVLLVLVQKEQSLVTRPSAYGYQRATGYACPDTAECDKKYFGFFNQLYAAAWQFREYADPSDDWHITPGEVAVQYAPDASCGSSKVKIANQATANLYLYTPYQPDAYTLAHPSGPAHGCSAFGNLNFFRLFNTWFGDSRAQRFPDWWGPCLNNVGGIACQKRN